MEISNCIFSFGTGGGSTAVDEFSTCTVSCCDVYGNEGGDWVGFMDGQEGINGNFSADPLFCAPDIGDFTLQNTSPCAPENNPDCGQIGAWPVGCDVAGVDEFVLGDPRLRSAPNPFTLETEVTFLIPAEPRAAGVHRVCLAVYDLSGRRVRALVDDRRSVGSYRVWWDGRDDLGRRVPSGTYFYRFDVGSQAYTRRIVLLR